MRRREFIGLIGGAAAWPIVARAQHADRMRRIGVLMTSADDADGRARFAAFRNALHALGWVDGANLRLDVRWGAANQERLRGQVEELLRLKPEAILATSGRVTKLLQGEAAEVSTLR